MLDNFVSDGFRLLLCGHTHGGQLRLPGYGALVSNCGLSPKLARGLTRWGMGLDPAWLHVSAGLGTSPVRPGALCLPARGLAAHPGGSGGLNGFDPSRERPVE